MKLIDKEQDVSAVDYFCNDPLDPLLELSAVLRSCHHARHIQRHDTLAAHRLRHFFIYNPLCQPLDDRSLADTRLTDQAWIVLRAAA